MSSVASFLESKKQTMMPYYVGSVSILTTMLATPKESICVAQLQRNPSVTFRCMSHDSNWMDGYMNYYNNDIINNQSVTKRKFDMRCLCVHLRESVFCYHTLTFLYIQMSGILLFIRSHWFRLSVVENYTHKWPNLMWLCARVYIPIMYYFGVLHNGKRAIA